MLTKHCPPHDGSDMRVLPMDVDEATVLPDDTSKQCPSETRETHQAEDISAEEANNDEEDDVEQLTSRSDILAYDGVHGGPRQHDDQEESQGA